MHNFKLAFSLSIAFFVTLASKCLAAQSPFTGSYTSSEADSQTQIVILNDKTFCYAFMGGSLDLFIGGLWEVDQKNKQSINLKEVRTAQTVHPAIATVLNRMNQKIGIEFDGYSISNANSAIFAMSQSAELPKTFKRLFPDNQSSWASTYSLPLFTPGDVKYLFIGDKEGDERSRDSKYRITQYEIGNHDAVRIGFDQNQARPVMNLNVFLKDNFLYINNASFAAKRSMTPKFIKEVQDNCIKPAVLAQTNEMLKAKRVFSEQEIKIEGAPYFSGNSKDENLEINSPEFITKNEQAELSEVFDKAKSNIKASEDFFKTAKALLNIKQRLNEHGPRVVVNYAELLVGIVGKGDFSSADKIFNSFMENVYPRVEHIKNIEAEYAISVIASQGLIMSVGQKRSDLEPIIFKKLLKNFEIKKHNNKVLTYNLACFYSTRSNKVAMLEAIKEARIRGVTSEQFLKDLDFEKYKNDSNFLKAIQ